MVAYDKRYFESPEGAGNAFLRETRDLPYLVGALAPEPGDRILDVGCGFGRFSELMAGHGATVLGIDVSEYAIGQAKTKDNHEGRLSFSVMNALEMDFDSQFDKILCFHFVEHLTVADGRTLLRNLHRALKSGGTLVLGLPIDDGQSVRRAVHVLAKRRAWRHLGHLTSYTVRGIRTEVRSAGFAVDDVCRLSYFGLRVPAAFPQLPFLGLPVICVDIKARKSA